MTSQSIGKQAACKLVRIRSSRPFKVKPNFLQKSKNHEEM
jgi:hypothetical protein